VVAVSLALQFLIELAALAAFGYWGSSTGSGWSAVLLAIAAPLVAAVAWGLLGSPRGPLHLRGIWRVVFEVVFFGLAAAALAVSGHAVLGVAFAAVVAANVAFLYAVGQGDLASS